MTDIPNWTRVEQEGYIWRNDNTDRLLGIRKTPDGEQWEVTGENSRVDTADTIEEAQEKALEFMRETPSPSAML